jgi:hypothetical protein
MTPEHAMNLIRSTPFPKIYFKYGEFSEHQQKEVEYLVSAMVKSFRNQAIAIFREETKAKY